MDTLLELAVVANPIFSVGILMISVILLEIPPVLTAILLLSVVVRRDCLGRFS